MFWLFEEEGLHNRILRYFIAEVLWIWNFSPSESSGGVVFLRVSKIKNTIALIAKRMGNFMNRIAVIGIILEQPEISQKAVNETISLFKKIIKGRMGIPFDDQEIAVISLTLQGELDSINALTGKLGNLPHVTVKTAVSKG